MLRDDPQSSNRWADGDGGSFRLNTDESGMSVLREMFPDGTADHMNLVLFSTSGINGSYRTIEEEEQNPSEDGITFVVIRPRVHSFFYGNAKPETQEDFVFLRRLRESSWAEFLQIGKANSENYATHRSRARAAR